MKRGVFGLGLLALAAASPARAGEEAAGSAAAPPAAPVAQAEGQEAVPVADVAAVRKGIERGVAYLVREQKRDGSWGSPASNLWDIYAPIPGSQRTFQVASTALALEGLLLSGISDPPVQRAIEKARAFLLSHCDVRRISPDTLYHVWALAYALEAFGHLLPLETDPARRKELLAASRLLVRRLDHYQFVEGGWGYYNFVVVSQSPGPGSTPFTTATVLIALKRAAAAGVPVSRGLAGAGVKLIRLCERPDNAFAYAPRHRFYPWVGVNKVKGSLGRTPTCLLALAAWGEEIPTPRFQKALADLKTYGHFLHIARKYPIPHEAWYANSGYFVLYGYRYAAETLQYLPPPQRAAPAGWMAHRVLKMQEKEGSFWDYQLFGYHKAYGTGFALQTLGRCREILETSGRVD